MAASNPIYKFIHAASYVTIIPLARLLPSSAVNEDSLNGLAKYLPAVGLLIGVPIAGLCLLLQKLGAPPLLTATIITIVWLTITGGLHFDGLMDTADGIFSHRSRDRMLEIMQDSRVGNFAVMVGMAAFALKIAALAAIAPHILAAVLLLNPSLARLAEAFAIGTFSYARPDGKGKVWHDTMKMPGDLFIASLVPIALLVGLIVLRNNYALLLCLYACTTCGAGAISAAYLNKRLGGHTGDTYGAVVELTETLSLTLVALGYPLLAH